VKFRSSEKTQFRSSEIRSSDRLPKFCQINYHLRNYVYNQIEINFFCVRVQPKFFKEEIRQNKDKNFRLLSLKNVCLLESGSNTCQSTIDRLQQQLKYAK
jgi:hypothetical protein